MKLKSLLIPTLGLAFATSVFAGSHGKAPAVVQPAEEAAPLGFTATVGYDTDYVFRGLETAQNLISAAIDGNIAINKDISFNVGAWYGASADDKAATYAGGTSYSELDLYAGLNAKLGPVTAGLKYTYYNYLGHASSFVKDVNEVGVTLATSAAGLDFIAGAYYDATARGYYFETGVSKTIKITEQISLVPGVLVSYGSHYYDVSGFNTVKPTLALPIKLTKSATLTPYIAGNLPIDALHDTGEKDRVYGGVALSVSF
jgi:uncharacterized protein (TIGR02001 family)